jgi:hypothetical protein
MASPFSIFRKNRTMMLVILTILSMFGFVFLPLFLQSMGSQAVSNPVAVKSKYGDLTMFDLHALRVQRQRVLNVLSSAMRGLARDPQEIRQYLESEAVFGPTTDQNLVESWLLTNRAHEMGMVVSNDIINGYLRRLTFNRVKTEDFKNAFRQAGVTESQFFNAMREELLALQLKETFQYNLQATTPAERWKYFTRVKEQASIEAVPVPAARYVDRIPEPPAADLKAFFEEHKEKDPNPDSPTPGFHVPKRIELQYVRADFPKVLGSVSDAEVAARYEKDKPLYEQFEKQSAAQKPEAKGQTEASKTVTAPGKPAATGQPAAGQPAASKAGAAPASAAAAKEKPTAGTQTPQKPTTPAPQSTDAKPPEKKADAKKPDEKKDDAKKPEEKKKVSGDDPSFERRSPFMLTAFAPDEKAKAAEPAKAAAPEKSAKAPETKDAKAPEKAAKSPETKEVKPPEKAAKAPEAKETKAPPAKAPEAKDAKATEKPAAKAAAAPAAEAKKPEAAKAGPSDQVKTLIRRQIASEKLQKAFQALGEQVDRYRSALSKFEDAKIKGLPASEPPPLDLAAMARQAGQTIGVPTAINAGATGWVSEVEAQQNEFCNSSVQTGQPVWSFAFASLSKYRTEMSFGRDGSFYYLFWKSGEQPARVPSFDDAGVAAQVLRAWKLIQARKPAAEEAKNLAEDARKSKGSLKQAFANRPDLPVLVPAPFSWLTFGQVPTGSSQQVQMSRVSGVEMAGTEFMEKVFSLKPGEVDVAFNAPKSIAYVIRLTGMNPAQDALWMQFKVDDFSTYRSATYSSQRQIYAAWLNEIKTSADLVWTKEYAASQQQQTGRQSSPASSPTPNESDEDY